MCVCVYIYIYSADDEWMTIKIESWCNVNLRGKSTYSKAVCPCASCTTYPMWTALSASSPLSETDDKLPEIRQATFCTCREFVNKENRVNVTNVLIHHFRNSLMTNVQQNEQWHIAHLRQPCHNSKLMIFEEKRLKVLNYYTFLEVQGRHNCSTAASFTNCVMTLYRFKVHLQTFLSLPINQKCQILSWQMSYKEWRIY